MSVKPFYSGVSGDVDPVILRQAIATGLNISSQGSLKNGTLFLYELKHYSTDGSTVTMKIDSNDLARVHPRLPLWTGYVVQQIFTQYDPGLLNTTLMQQEDINPMMFNAAGVSTGVEPVQVTGFNEITVGENSVIILFGCLERLVRTGRLQELYRYRTTSVARSLSYMDEHYPDWKSRFTIAQELGLDAEAAANYTMNFTCGVQAFVSVSTGSLPSF